MTNQDTKIKSERLRDNTMEINKLSTAVISILITLSICLATFSYKTGQTQQELQNLREHQIVMKQDLKEDISGLDENKAEKEIVELIFKKIDDIQKQNEADHKAVFEKLDRIIEKEI